MADADILPSANYMYTQKHEVGGENVDMIDIIIIYLWQYFIQNPSLVDH